MFQRVLLTVLCGVVSVIGQPKDTISDESKVPAYELPEVLEMSNGTKVVDATMWRKQRRPEILRVFETEMYGKMPGKPPGMTFKVVGGDSRALGGKAIRKEVTVFFTGKTDGPQMD